MSSSEDDIEPETMMHCLTPLFETDPKLERFLELVEQEPDEKRRKIGRALYQIVKALPVGVYSSLRQCIYDTVDNIEADENE